MTRVSDNIYDFPGREKFHVEATVNIQAESLKKWTANVMSSVGMSKDDAQIMAEVLVESDLLGVDTHGLYKIGLWVKRALQGGSDPKAEFRIMHEAKTTAAVDAGTGFGQVMGYKGMQLAMEKADQYASGFVTIRNSTSLTAARYYAIQAAKQGKIGLVLTNADPVAAPWGGTTPMLGTNPWCIAVPGEEYPVVMDTASTVTAWTKLVVHANAGKKIPDGWALDANGNPTNDPIEGMNGSVLPMGGHKGFMFGMFADIFSGVLSGGAFLNQTLNYGVVEKPTNTAHFFGAFDVEGFMSLTEFKSRISQVISTLKSSEKAPGVEELRIPGEQTNRTYNERLITGIPINPRRLENMMAISEAQGIQMPAL
jgi:LDH2 family malate/lactate/ureidoglycolate dehydrogenase